MQVKVAPELYDAAMQKAKKSGLTLSQVMRGLLIEYTSNPQSKLIF